MILLGYSSTFDMSNLDLFPLISPSDIVSITKLTLILKIICQCSVKYVMMLPIKAITPELKILTYNITSIIPHPLDSLQY